MRRALFLGLALMLAACSFNRFGRWLDESDQPLEGSQILQYPGFPTCGHEQVIFLFFFGDLYARDDRGDLGVLTNPDGEVLTFAILDEIPSGAEPTGIHHQDLEIYLDPEDRADYIYIHRGDDGRTERWPRAEIACDRPDTPG
jgi:hypothetical protein